MLGTRNKVTYLPYFFMCGETGNEAETEIGTRNRVTGGAGGGGAK
jgi:hypothetical protein